MDEGRSRPGSDGGASFGIALVFSRDIPISIGAVAMRFCVPRLIPQAELNAPRAGTFGTKKYGPASAFLASSGQEVAALRKFLYRARTQGGRASLHASTTPALTDRKPIPNGEI
jgi:hypothetical protein